MVHPSFWEILLIILLNIVLFVGVIWAIFQWFKFFMKKDINKPLDIAKERYARGEITKAELDEIKKNLS